MRKIILTRAFAMLLSKNNITKVNSILWPIIFSKKITNKFLIYWFK